MTASRDGSPRIRHLAALTALALTAGGLTVVATPAVADTGTVYGAIEVRDSQGDIITDATAFLQPLTTSGAAALSVGPDGRGTVATDWFDLYDLPQPVGTEEVDVTLRLSVRDYRNMLVTSNPLSYVWDGAQLVAQDDFEPAEPAPVRFSADSTETLQLAIDIDLPDGVIEGQLTSSVAISGEVDYAGVTIYRLPYIFDVFNPAFGRVDDSGFFRVTGLPDGDYAVQGRMGVPFAGQHPYGLADTFVPGTSRLAEAQVFTIENESTINSIAIELEPNALVTGSLERVINGVRVPAGDLKMNPGGFSARGSGVSMFAPGSDATDPDAFTARAFGGFGAINNGLGDGEYEMVVAPGTYQLAFGSIASGPGSPFATYSYWQNKTDLALADEIEIAPGQTYVFDALLPSFDDVAAGNQFIAEITWLAARGVSTGYNDGTFRPLAPVGRDAMAAFLYRFAGEPAFTPPVTPSFLDVPTSNQFYKEIEWLRSTGITTGYPDRTFRPLGTVARDAMAAFLFRFSEFIADEDSTYVAPGTSPFIDVPTSNQFYREVAWLAEQGISTGYSDSTFRTLASVNRDAMAAFLFRFGGLLLSDVG